MGLRSGKILKLHGWVRRCPRRQGYICLPLKLQRARAEDPCGELARIDIQRSSKQDDNAEGRLVPAAFEQRWRGAVKVGQFGEALLRQPAFLARLSQNLAEHLSDRSRNRAVAVHGSIGLGMSVPRRCAALTRR
jgi:hypothetical protein